METIDALTFQWTVIVAAIILFLGMGGFSGLIIWAVRTGMNSVRSELRVDITEFKAELKSDIAELRTELKGDIAEFRTELKGDIAELRTELKGDIADLRTELKGDIAELRTELKLDIQANRNEITTNRRLLARFALHRHGDDGLPLAPLTDSLDPPEGTGGNGEANG